MDLRNSHLQRKSQILDETGDLENDLNDTTTLGGFIADDTTLNDTANQTNWTLGEHNRLYKNLKIKNSSRFRR